MFDVCFTCQPYFLVYEFCQKITQNEKKCTKLLHMSQKCSTFVADLNKSELKLNRKTLCKNGICPLHNSLI